jgi:hypothetical protein
LEKGGLKKKLAASKVADKAGVFWADEMRVGLIGETRRVWAPRGVKVVQEREYEHVWTYLNLAVNGLSGDLHWSWTKDMKAASIAPVVKSWAEQGVEAVVWDGAQGHRGAAYEEVSVERIFQPPYSPELNPAERVFEFLRERIEGVVYGSLHNKKAAVEAELEKLAADPERVKSLTGWSWIHQAVAGLHEGITCTS